MKTENIKCGEIYRCGPGKFTFNCVYCPEYFDSKTIALDHIESHFIIDAATSSSLVSEENQHFKHQNKGNPSLDIKAGTHIEDIAFKIEVLDSFADPLSSFECAEIKQEPELVFLNEDEDAIPPISIPFPNDIKAERSTNSKKRIVTCNVCQKTMQRANLVRHMSSHANLREYKCLNCDFGFNSKDHLTKHLRNRTQCKGKNIQVFSVEPEAVLPNEDEHAIPSIPIRFSNDMKAESPTNSKKRIVTCDVCQRTMQRANLVRHMSSHANLREYKCSNCNYGFNSKDNLTKHLRNHSQCKDKKIQYFSGEWGPSHYSRMVTCDICKKELQHRSMTSHMQAHANLRQFECNVCKKRFNKKTSLQIHSKIHFTVKQFSCHYCAAQFFEKRNLYFHIMTHTGEKPYKCTACDKRFTQPYSLTVHFRTHTGEKPYTCEICGKSFRTHSYFTKHKRSHTNIKTHVCTVCDKGFTLKKSLREHSRTHTGERPYSCHICGNAFSRSNTFKQHMMLHSGEKPYKCRFCDMGFAQGAGRRSHEKSVHKDIDRSWTLVV